MATQVNGPRGEGRRDGGCRRKVFAIAALVGLALVIATGTALLVVEIGKGMTALRQARERGKELTKEMFARKLRDRIAVILDDVLLDPPPIGCPRPPTVTPEDLERLGSILKEAVRKQAEQNQQPAHDGKD
ncbi:MAG TPA: hypothetical protein VEL76_33060 [Gemmataceae bacterium]|nr:hypothetical protein [Gemmataceae bacterium]